MYYASEGLVGDTDFATSKLDYHNVQFRRIPTFMHMALRQPLPTICFLQVGRMVETFLRIL